jgi:N utilization substance protein B
MSQKSPRRRAREFALQALYQWQIAGQSLAFIEKQFGEAEHFERADARFFNALVAGVMKHHDALAAALAPHLDRQWAEVSPIEKGALLIGALELAHMPQTPYRVVINEAIELGKLFGGTDGHKYVNGILDKLAIELRRDEGEALRMSGARAGGRQERAPGAAKAAVRRPAAKPVVVVKKAAKRAS